MNRKLFLWSITGALGGLLFGLDTAVISGAELAIQKLWNLSDVLHGFAIAAALYGTVIGAMFGGIPADRWGRKKTLLWIGVSFFVSALGSAVAQDVYTFMFFRFLGGLAIGASSVAAPLYISEIAPAKYRGRMVILFQFNIVLGILLAYLSNYLLQDLGENSWRWMLGIVGAPSLLFAILIPLLPESPRWLMVQRGDEEGARKILQISDPAGVETALQSIRTSESKTNVLGKTSLFSGNFNWPIMLAFLFAFFNQVAGINAIIYYAPRIFELTGLGKSAALLSSVGIGLANLAATMCSIFLIDKVGRRTLMLIGSVGLIITLALVALAFKADNHSLTPTYIFVYIAFFAFSQGAVIWVFISEIFPNQVRASGQSLGSATHWVFAALITNLFPICLSTFGPVNVFCFFTVMMVLQLFYVIRMMPETKGVSLEDLEPRILH
jgi:MFS transporter, SP family, arabinose:H+ symporter